MKKLVVNAYVGYIDPNTKKVQYIEVTTYGYPEYLGRILKQRYNTVERIKHLIEQGDVQMMHLEFEEIIFFKDLEEYLGPSYKEDFGYKKIDSYFDAKYNYLFDYKINDWLYRRNKEQFKILL